MLTSLGWLCVCVCVVWEVGGAFLVLDSFLEQCIFLMTLCSSSPPPALTCGRALSLTQTREAGYHWRSGQSSWSVAIEVVVIKFEGRTTGKFVQVKGGVCIEDIGDGNLNDVVRVSSKSDPAKSIILKHAMPFIKVLGPRYPLATERGEIEYRASSKFYAICPGSVPRPLCYSKAHKIFCMEDLQGYQVYKQWLMAGNTDLDVAKKLARDIAIIHQNTHVGVIGQQAIKNMNEEFQNPHLVKLTDTYIFTDPFSRTGESNRWSSLLNSHIESVYGDEELLSIVKKFQKLFHEKKEALIHGDLHTGSAMVRDKDIRMIDLEFIMVGPCAMDLGLLMAHYIFCHLYHLMNTDEDETYRHPLAYKILDLAYATVDEYLAHMTSSIGERENYTSQLMSETAGFAGCEIIRRLLGAGRTIEMDSLESAQPDALAAGIRLLKAHSRIHSVFQLMNVALMLTF
ncbi:uncharacterized protein LOC112562862 isoform X1 [Pomacea canaliculata]|uniref:uncharacterized protein LOC112562862 isoform X1 n=1 Tax=Pomacea canaliculata TaxID=400727 RepID=UPI000D727FAF|nr:uncharacterized protein LOC112562862 isoform X1 [Pomacea canaliculata]